MHARTRCHVFRPLLVAAACGAMAGAAPAGDSPTAGGVTDPDLSWYTIDGGGGVSVAGDLQLLGTIGQPDAGGPAVGGDWSVTGGFLVGGDLTPPLPCPADLDGSGAVDFGDLLSVLSVFGACDGCPEDLDGNGAVDFNDLLGVLSAFGPCP